MKTEYSVECEECGIYNFSPIKCGRCWTKQRSEEIKEILIEYEKVSTSFYKPALKVILEQIDKLDEIKHEKK